VKARYRDVSPAELDALRRTARIVDVREPHELAGELGRIPGVEPAPLSSFDPDAIPWSREESIVLVCRSGARSGRVAEVLVAAGFRRVMNLAGGMLAYNDAGLPVERG
jgi:rhodanese-related sulfurtransferase